ncbi:MAG: 2-oxoglutarate dehydrogenase, E2 component, dihydrolipoamide succinyltransferase [Candidatus Kapaibacterium sp.]
MKVDVVMPKMGESLQEGTITKWLKQEGDHVERDEMILEISTDKVDTEVPSPIAGKLVKILSQENETVEVGEKIAEIEAEDEERAQEVQSEMEDVQKEGGKEEKPEKEEKTKEKSEKKEEKKEEPEEEAYLEVEDAEGDLVEIVMPKMGESLQEGTITKWLKSEGDKVERDEMILEISTDKVDTEVPSPVGGTLAEIIVGENETVEVGEVIAKISTGEGKPAKKEKKAEKAGKAEQKLPGKSEEKPSREGQEIPRREGKKFFSPVVREMAKDQDVSVDELESIEGSGVDGRVTRKDLEAYLEDRKKAPEKTEKAKPAPKKEEKPAAKEAPKPLPKAEKSPDEWGHDVEVIPMNRVRRLIAEHMVYSKHTSAHVTSVGEADVTAIFKYRSKIKDEFQKKEGFKLTFTPFFAKAIVDGVKDFPMVNVSVDGTDIIRHKPINLGFATALPDGNLIVPVIKKAEALNLTGLAREVYDLSNKARNKQLNPEDIQGGTITVTNVGTFGTLFGTPVINQPQAAIIGVGAIKKRPVVKEIDGEDVIVARHMAYVSITYDHRVVDGMLAGQCLASIIKHLEAMNEDNMNL